MATKIHKWETRDRNEVAITAISGGSIVEVVAGGVQPASNGSLTATGWVPYDVEAGERVPVYNLRGCPVRASGAIPPGSRLACAAGGAAKAGGGAVAGVVIGHNTGTARVDGEEFIAAINIQ